MSNQEITDKQKELIKLFEPQLKTIESLDSFFYLKTLNFDFKKIQEQFELLDNRIEVSIQPIYTMSAYIFSDPSPFELAAITDNRQFIEYILKNQPENARTQILSERRPKQIFNVIEKLSFNPDFLKNPEIIIFLISFLPEKEKNKEILNIIKLRSYHKRFYPVLEKLIGHISNNKEKEEAIILLLNANDNIHDFNQRFEKLVPNEDQFKIISKLVLTSNNLSSNILNQIVKNYILPSNDKSLLIKSIVLYSQDYNPDTETKQNLITCFKKLDPKDKIEVLKSINRKLFSDDDFITQILVAFPKEKLGEVVVSLDIDNRNLIFKVSNNMKKFLLSHLSDDQKLQAITQYDKYGHNIFTEEYRDIMSSFSRRLVFSRSEEDKIIQKEMFLLLPKEAQFIILKDLAKNPIHHYEQIKHFLGDSFKYKGNPLKVTTDEIYKALASYDNRFAIMSEAKKIIDFEKKIKQHEFGRLANVVESSMDREITKRADNHFENKIKVYFNKKFQEYGDNDEQRLTNIENEIRKTLLEQIKINLSNELIILKEKATENKVDIERIESTLKFITENETKLISGDKNTLKEAREKYFYSHYRDPKSDTVQLNPDQVHTAWRAYDPYAPVKGSWPNLFTPVTNPNEISYTLDGSRSLGENNNIIRERAAYYYLVATDKIGSKEEQEDRLQDFILEIAECRRGHESDDLDDPSCFPGYITRLSRIGQKHPIAKLPDTAKEIIEETFRGMIYSKFAESIKAFKENQINKQELLNRYESLVSLGNYNADILSNDPSDYPSHLFELRTKFIESLGSIQELQEKINKKFMEKLSRNMTNEEWQLYGEYSRINPGGSYAVESLNELLRNNVELYTPSTDEILNANIEKKKNVEHPFPLKTEEEIHRGLTPLQKKQPEQKQNELVQKRHEKIWNEHTTYNAIFPVLKNYFNDQQTFEKISEMARAFTVELVTYENKSEAEKINALLQDISNNNPEQQKILSKFFPKSKKGEDLSADLLAEQKKGEALTKDLIHAMENRPHYQKIKAEQNKETKVMQEQQKGLFPLRTALETKEKEEKNKLERENAPKRDHSEDDTYRL